MLIFSYSIKPSFTLLLICYSFHIAFAESALANMGLANDHVGDVFEVGELEKVSTIRKFQIVD